MSIYEKLMKVQCELKAPKSQRNDFGKYNYRSCEDILEALKPILSTNKLAIVIKDSVEQIGERFYIKATVTLFDVETGDKIETEALAREEESKKGMDSSQLTGSCSSYARKYALNGMFAIDDTKDSDATNKHGKDAGDVKPEVKPEVQELIALASKKGFGVGAIKSKVLKDFKKTELNKLTVRELKMLTDGFNGLPDK